MKCWKAMSEQLGSCTRQASQIGKTCPREVGKPKLDKFTQSRVALKQATRFFCLNRLAKQAWLYSKSHSPTVFERIHRVTRSPIPLPQVRGFLQTQRTDYWWIQPILVLLGLGGFVVYSTWAAFQGCNYFTGGVDQPGVQRLLSPFYSPVLWDPRGIHSGHAWFGELPSWWPAWMFFSPALLILP